VKEKKKNLFPRFFFSFSFFFSLSFLLSLLLSFLSTNMSSSSSNPTSSSSSIPDPANGAEHSRKRQMTGPPVSPTKKKINLPQHRKFQLRKGFSNFQKNLFAYQKRNFIARLACTRSPTRVTPSKITSRQRNIRKEKRDCLSKKSSRTSSHHPSIVFCPLLLQGPTRLLGLH